MEWINIEKQKPNISEKSYDVLVVTDGMRYTVKPACQLYYKEVGGALFAPAFGGTGIEVKWWFVLDGINAK